MSSIVRSLIEREFVEESNRAKGDFTVPELSLGGSYAKGTWLRNSADIDYFLLYPTSFSRDKLEGEAIRVAREAVKNFGVTMRFAEHPYVEASVKGVRVNIVPCYKVAKGEWQSAADRSPFHTEYVKSKFDEGLRLETRLLKKFVKCSGVYGAEVKVQGFSGYVCEVLTLKYGSFQNALRNIADSIPGEVVSVEENYDKELVSSFKSALVILDPVDQARNLGSAISTENVAKLVLRFRRFLSRPSLAYFREIRAIVRRSDRILEEKSSESLVKDFHHFFQNRKEERRHTLGTAEEEL